MGRGLWCLDLGGSEVVVVVLCKLTYLTERNVLKSFKSLSAMILVGLCERMGCWWLARVKVADSDECF